MQWRNGRKDDAQPEAATREYQYAPVRLGDILIAKGFVEWDIVEAAAAVQRMGVNRRIGRLLVEQGHITQAQLDLALKIQPGLAPANYDVVTGRLGDMAVDMRFVSRNVVERLAAEQKVARGQVKKRLGAMLLERGGVTETHLAKAVARRHGVPFVRLGKLLDSPSAFTEEIMPVDHMGRLRVIPVEMESGRLIAVVEDPSDLAALREAEKLAGASIDAVVSTPAEIRYALTNYIAAEAMQASRKEAARERLAEGSAGEEAARTRLRAVEARLSALRAELEERSAARMLAVERAEEKLESCEDRSEDARVKAERAAAEHISNEKAALEDRFAARQASAEERLRQATEVRLALEKRLSEAKAAFANRLAHEMDDAEQMVEASVDVERRITKALAEA